MPPATQEVPAGIRAPFAAVRVPLSGPPPAGSGPTYPGFEGPLRVLRTPPKSGIRPPKPSPQVVLPAYPSLQFPLALRPVNGTQCPRPLRPPPPASPWEIGGMEWSGSRCGGPRQVARIHTHPGYVAARHAKKTADGAAPFIAKTHGGESPTRTDGTLPAAPRNGPCDFRQRAGPDIQAGPEIRILTRL